MPAAASSSSSRCTAGPLLWSVPHATTPPAAWILRMFSCAIGVISFIQVVQVRARYSAAVSRLELVALFGGQRRRVQRLIEILRMLGETAVVLADRQRARERHLLRGHELHERIADRALDDRMRERVQAGVDRFERAELVGDVRGRADAVLVVVAHDLLGQVGREQRDHRPRAPAFLLDHQLDHVGLLLGDVRVEQRLVLLEVRDADRDAIAMAARIGDRVAGGEDARREDLPGALIGAQRQDQLLALPASNTVVTPE